MKYILAVSIIILSVAVAGLAVAQPKTARSGSYETLSDANRRIVSAIYESQLGSRRDLDGHPLLSKDQITGMRQGSTWQQVFERLAKQGYVAFGTLQEAVASYSREAPPMSRPLIINRASGEQIIVPRQVAPRRSPPSPDPTLANVIPTPPVRRAHIKVVELPVLNASGETQTSAEPSSIGLIAPSIAATAAQSR